MWTTCLRWSILLFVLLELPIIRCRGLVSHPKHQAQTPGSEAQTPGSEAQTPGSEAQTPGSEPNTWIRSPNTWIRSPNTWISLSRRKHQQQLTTKYCAYHNGH